MNQTHFIRIQFSTEMKMKFLENDFNTLFVKTDDYFQWWVHACIALQRDPVNCNCSTHIKCKHLSNSIKRLSRNNGPENIEKNAHSMNVSIKISFIKWYSVYAFHFEREKVSRFNGVLHVSCICLDSFRFHFLPRRNGAHVIKQTHIKL